MFQRAIAIADAFTRPVVISRRTVRGQCGSSIGTFIILNDEGWILTCAHILRGWKKLTEEADATKKTMEWRKTIEENASLTRKERAQQISQGPKVSLDSNERCSAWWSWDDARLNNFKYMDAEDKEFRDIADIGVGQLIPFNPKSVKNYAVFKNPDKEFEPGKSLCRLGFPFHSFTPSFDEKNERFVLPKGALPMPRFPNEGIFTRTAEIQIENGDPPFPIRYIETSTPGLKGQSGGPIFDSEGRIWGVQAKTVSLNMGFKPDGHPQYLNLGLGVHPKTIFGFLDSQKVKYQVSED